MTATTTALRIRHLERHEAPPDLWPGLELDLNTHWVWCAADADDRPVAVLLTAPAHGALLLLRIWAAPGCPRMAIRRLLSEVAREAIALGLSGWATMLSGTGAQPAELRLMKLALRYRATLVPFAGMLAAGRLENLCRS